MAEATSSITQFPTIHITTAAHVLSMLRARNAVKEELRKQGLKVSHFAAREITSWAQVYLDDHHETLIPPAIDAPEFCTAELVDLGSFSDCASLERFPDCALFRSVSEPSPHLLDPSVCHADGLDRP